MNFLIHRISDQNSFRSICGISIESIWIPLISRPLFRIKIDVNDNKPKICSHHHFSLSRLPRNSYVMKLLGIYKVVSSLEQILIKHYHLTFLTCAYFILRNGSKLVPEKYSWKSSKLFLRYVGTKFTVENCRGKYQIWLKTPSQERKNQKGLILNLKRSKT